MFFGSVPANIPAERLTSSSRGPKALPKSRVAQLAQEDSKPTTAQKHPFFKLAHKAEETIKATAEITGMHPSPLTEEVKKRIEDYVRPRPAPKTFAVQSSFAPTRPLFLEMEEKLTAISNHRLQMIGWFDQKDDDSDDEISTLGGSEGAKTDSGSEEALEDEDWLDAVVDQLDGEERSSSQLRSNEDLESDTESEYAEEPYDDVFLTPMLEKGKEWEATCAINGTSNQAAEYANLVLQTNNRGMLRGFIEKKRLSGNGAWVHCRKMFTAWIRKLHAGCDFRLDYDPLMQATFELIVGWNIRMVYGRKTKKGGYLLEGGIDVGRIQEEAAEEKAAKSAETRLLVAEEKNAISWGVGKRWTRRQGKARK